MHMDQKKENILTFEPSQHHPEMFKAWETFVRTGQINRDIVPPHILESWLRSKESGVDPFRLPLKSRLEEKEYKEKLKHNRELIEISRSIMESISSSLERTRYLVVLFDSEGYHLARIGQRADLERSNNLNIVEGLCFDEHMVGTCGFSLVKRHKKPMQILGCEHYTAPLHYVTGSYAPIMSRKTNDLLGVIGVSGAKTIPNDHTQAIVFAASKAIENLLTINEAKDNLYIYSQALQITMDSFDDGVLLVDKNGIVHHINMPLRNELHLTDRTVIGSHINNVFNNSPLKTAILKALRDSHFEQTRFEFKSNGQIYIVTLKSVSKSASNVQGLLIQFKSVKKLSRIMQDLTESSPGYTLESMVGHNEKLLETKSVAKIASESDIPVLIEGESGTGKEVLAQGIHNASSRSDKPFVVVNCAAIPAELFESTLFGHEKGAFTGAVKTQIGKFELSDGGTLFLDEISELPILMQAKLLRILEGKMMERVGGQKDIRVDVRIIAASNRDIYELVQDNDFRKDLFYRLNVFRIVIPPLRERKEDLPDLVYYFIKQLSPFFNKRIKRVDDSCLRLLMEHDWPGNVRELKNAVQFALAKSSGDTFYPEHFKDFLKYLDNQNLEYLPVKQDGKLEALENELIFRRLKLNRGNKTKTAKDLGIGRATLYRKLKGIENAAESFQKK